jgi:hypothetical protein
VGTYAWQQNNSGYQPGYVLNDANFAFPDTSMPSGYASYPDVPGGGDYVSILSATTNQIVYTQVSSLPGSPGQNETIGPVTTNQSYVTSSVYPGAVSGLTTNTDWTTTSTWPGNVSGLITNCVGFTTQTNNNPGATLCSTTTSGGTTTSATYPGPIPGLVTNTIVTTTGTNKTVTTTSTNCTGFTTSGTYPGAGKLCLSSNATSSGTITNCTGTTLFSTNSYPGNQYRYCGITTNSWNNGNGQGQGNAATVYGYHPFTTSGFTNYSYTYETAYNYTYATNYTYTYATNYTYTYPLTIYTYATSFTYTYPSYTYTYPKITYTYVVYTDVFTYETNHYDHIIYPGKYKTTGDITGTTLVLGDVTIVMPNGLNMSGGDSMTLDASGSPQGHLTVYAGGTDLTIGGNGSANFGVNNKPGYADNFTVLAAPSVTKVSLSGNASFTGVLVAPNADIKLNGGGNNTYDFVGALMANSITMNGHFNFHYDEALAKKKGTGKYLITSWNEMP